MNWLEERLAIKRPVMMIEDDVKSPLAVSKAERMTFSRRRRVSSSSLLEKLGARRFCLKAKVAKYSLTGLFVFPARLSRSSSGNNFSLDKYQPSSQSGSSSKSKSESRSKSQSQRLLIVCGNFILDHTRSFGGTTGGLPLTCSLMSSFSRRSN